MAFREVHVFDVREVLRLWLGGEKIKVAARQVGMDPKTVRGYVRAAQRLGLVAGAGEAALTDEIVAKIAEEYPREGGRPRGPGWAICEEQRAFIEELIKDDVDLTKVRKLLRRKRQVQVSYGVLRRFAQARLGWSEPEPDIPLADGKPGEELQVDTGWMTYLVKDERGRRRRFRAWIFTPVVSRYRFVYPVLTESTATAVEACEAAWEFYGGVFGVLIPDNTKAIVLKANPLSPVMIPAFREYAQARGFAIDPTRIRKPKDKARVENAVKTVRRDCFGGEKLLTVVHAREHALWWCTEEYGATSHRTTRRLPREHFTTEEQAKLKPAPTEVYDTPRWYEEVVAGSNQLAPVAGAFYSLPKTYCGPKLRARVDRSTVRFYVRQLFVKLHARVPSGKRSVDASDYPPEKAIYAFRNSQALVEMATSHGEAVGLYAARLLEAPEPWTRMRRAYYLLRLVKRYGAARVDEACRLAAAADMIDVHRLEKMLALAPSPTAATERGDGKVVPIARFLRPVSHFALHRTRTGSDQGGAK